jgi:hypothetical protein
MARNGSGTMSIDYADFQSGANIVADELDANFSTIVEEITNSVAVDGQSTMSGDLAMGTNKITGVGDPTSAQDVVTKAYFEANASAGVNPNLIINGDMRIAQRGTSFTSVVNGDYTLDRWNINESTDGVIDIKQNTTVVPSNTANSLEIDVTTLDAALTASQLMALAYLVEGNDLQHVKIGTSDAKTLTLSFDIRSNKTGTFAVIFRNDAKNRHYISEVTINVADTWETKTVTIAMDTTGTWATDNTAGLEIFWTFANGPDVEGTAGAWTAGNLLSTANVDNWMDSVSNFIYLTNVKLEVGSTATAFVPDDYGTALAKCRRYYQIIGGAVNAFAYKWYQTTNGYIQHTLTLAAAMRAIPTLTKNGTWNTTNCGQPFFSSSHPGTIWFQSQTTSTGASGLYTDSTDDTVEMDAEL